MENWGRNQGRGLWAVLAPGRCGRAGLTLALALVLGDQGAREPARGHLILLWAITTDARRIFLVLSIFDSKMYCKNTHNPSISNGLSIWQCTIHPEQGDFHTDMATDAGIQYVPIRIQELSSLKNEDQPIRILLII